MVQFSRRSLLVASLLVGFAGASRASTIFSIGPDPFPDGSVISLKGATHLCPVTNQCVRLAEIRDLKLVSASSTAGGFTEDLTADLTAELVNIVTNTVIGSSELKLTPGTFFEVSITGGYNPFTNPVGIFPEVIDALSVQGVGVHGGVVTADLAASPPSTGSVTITSADGGFDITNVLNLNVSATLNGNPFPVPPITGTSAAVPEAPFWTMLLIGFGGLGSLARLQRRVVLKAV